MRVAVIGTGAMGSLFAARLAPVCDLVMLGGWTEQLEILEKRGLTVIDLDGSEHKARFPVCRSPLEVNNRDLALVLVKSWQTERAAGQASQVLAKGAVALTLQNGLGNDRALAAQVGNGRVAIGVTSEGATMLRPGVVRYAGRGITHLSGPHTMLDRLGAVQALLQQAGFEAHMTNDPSALVWGKLAVNAGINPLTALLMVPNGLLCDHESTRQLMIRAAEETAAVAAAQGISLPYESAADRVAEVARATATNLSSMVQDITRGAPTEVEAINGAVVEHGRALKVPTPVNAALLELMRVHLTGKEWRSHVIRLPHDCRTLFEQLALLRTTA
jgi:2-dehydropantoate 2-reductase